MKKYFAIVMCVCVLLLSVGCNNNSSNDVNLKDEGTLREVIHELSKMTGKEVSKEKEDKIIKAVVEDKVPKDIDKLV